MEDLAAKIVKRANSLGISINQLCKNAGVSRRWFEYLKKRVPESLEVYFKIDNYLNEMENSKTDNEKK